MKRRGWVTAGMMLAVVVVGALAILGADASASARPFVVAAGAALLITVLVFLFAWVPRLQAEARTLQVTEVVRPELAVRRRARRRRLRLLGAALMLAGGLTLVGATFLDWLHDGTVVRGWQLYDVQSKAGDNLWVIGDMFGGVTPFVTGLTTLVGGLVVIVLALVAVVVPVSERSRRWLMHPALGAPLVFAVLFVFWLCVFNVYQTSRNGAGAQVSIGLYLCVAASLLASVGATVATVSSGESAVESGHLLVAR